MRAIIDADILRYQIGAIELENEFATPYLKENRVARMPAPVDQIQRIVDNTIKDVLEATGADSYICPLSGKGNFRLEIAKQQPYKGNRDPNVARPYHYGTVGDWIRANHPSVMVDGMEADDWMAIEQREDPENNVICSRDKDLKTCFGWHYRWACGDKQPEHPIHWITEFESKAFFFHQMLIGDNTDNIPGCGERVEMMWGGKLCLRRKGIGAKKAEQLLADCESVQDLFDVVKQCYLGQFGEDLYEEKMLENARLLYIGQTPENLFEWDWLDYDLKRNSNETVCSEVPENEQHNCSEPTDDQHDCSERGRQSGESCISGQPDGNPEQCDDSVDPF